MSVDKAKLKALAEKATPVCEWYEPGELRYADDKSGEIHGLHHDDDSYIAAANPATILALMGEIERLESDAASMRGSLKAQGKDLTTAVRQCSRAVRERDQLKAENDALRRELKEKTEHQCAYGDDTVAHTFYGDKHAMAALTEMIFELESLRKVKP